MQPYTHSPQVTHWPVEVQRAAERYDERYQAPTVVLDTQVTNSPSEYEKASADLLAPVQWDALHTRK